MELLPKTYNYLLSGLTKSKSVGKAKKEIGSAIDNEIAILWKKVRPILIKEDPSLINDLEQKDINDTLTGGFKYLLSRKLQDEDFYNLIKIHLDRLIAIEKSSSNIKKVIKTSIKGRNHLTIIDSTVNGLNTKS